MSVPAPCLSKRVEVVSPVDVTELVTINVSPASTVIGPFGLSSEATVVSVAMATGANMPIATDAVQIISSLLISFLLFLCCL